MCRILFLQGSDTLEALSYLDAFFRSGEDDPYLQDVLEEYAIPNLKNQHIHGWGYILVTSQSIHEYTNGTFFKEDISWKNTLKTLLSERQWDFLLMAELRLTEEGYVSAFNAHPFHFISRNGYEGYLFYNGLLDYQKLAELEKIDYRNYHTKNGTTLMGISIARELEAGKSMQEALEKPKQALKSAYNIMMFYRDNMGKYKALIHAYLHTSVCDCSCVRRYNKVLQKKTKSLHFIGASAIEHYKKEEYTVLENGAFLEFDIDFIKEYYFDANAHSDETIFF